MHLLFQLHLHLAGSVVEKLLKVGFEDFIDYIGEGVRMHLSDGQQGNEGEEN